jgi:hypothetical protein
MSSFGEKHAFRFVSDAVVRYQIFLRYLHLARAGWKFVSSILPKSKTSDFLDTYWPTNWAAKRSLSKR